MKKKTKLKLNRGYEFTLTEEWEKRQAQIIVDSDTAGGTLSCSGISCNHCIFGHRFKDDCSLCCSQSALIPKKYRVIHDDNRAETILYDMGYRKATVIQNQGS